jgi:hypothetical protein
MVVTTSTNTRIVLSASSVQLAITTVGTPSVPGSLVVASTSDVLSMAVSSQNLAAADLFVDVQASFSGFDATPARLRLTNDVVSLVGLTDIRLSGQSAGRSFYTLSGFANVTTNQIIMGGRFNDSTVRPDLVTVGGPLLPGVVAYSAGGFASVVGVNLAGTVTLRGNAASPASVVASVAYAAGVTTSVAVACDLQPAVGDVDLGSQNLAAPMPSMRINTVFAMEVRINTGSVAMGSIDVTITYPPALLEVLTSGSTPQIVGGRNWPGGIFQAVVNPPGTIRLGGVPSTGILNSNAHIATITFRTRVAGTAAIQGSVTTFAQGDRAGTPIGGAAPRSFVSGDFDIIITQTRDRRSTEAMSTEWAQQITSRSVAVPSGRRRRQTALCSDINYVSPPCNTCVSERERGDTNGDCEFDIRDVGFVQLYKVEESFGFSRPEGQAIQSTLLPVQLTALDADLDNEITPADAL